MKNYLIGFLVLTIGAVGALAWRQRQELAENRIAGVQAGTDRISLEQRAAEAEKHAQDLATQLAAAKSKADDDLFVTSIESSAPSNPSGPMGPNRGVPATQFAPFRTLLEKPEVQQLVSFQQKAALDAKYSVLFKRLSLSAEHVDQVKSLLIARQTSRQDILNSASQDGIDLRADPATLRKRVVDAQTEIADKLKNVLGAEHFALFKAYEQTLPQRTVVNQLQQSLIYSTAPLSDAQAEKLIQVLAANSPLDDNRGAPAGYQAGFAGGFQGGYGRAGQIGAGQPGAAAGNLSGILDGASGATITTAAITQAQEVLTASQIQALQQLQQTQQTQQQVLQLLRDSANPNATAAVGGMRPRRPAN